ncbi:hypothetical protein BT96DRAFT_14259 [Gymnopus androsaceus JB14]|uniref:Uncharacterized protein n=1 Tax=Gymnopus androsaceus JB14 TaxID=1447944 RepID=A0A6A4IVQ3_9AGAR|nr:hypothetical protein BT96DRAFT_14259 [Gymnopus androsaceus JB14]
MMVGLVEMFCSISTPACTSADSTGSHIRPTTTLGAYTARPYIPLSLVFFNSHVEGNISPTLDQRDDCLNRNFLQALNRYNRAQCFRKKDGQSGERVAKKIENQDED